MKHGFVIIFILFLLVLAACEQQEKPAKKTKSFLQIGEFTITRESDSLTLARDGAGRTLALVPRDAPAPEGYAPSMIIRTPIRRVAAYGSFDVATLRALGVLDETLVAVTTPREKWFVDDVQRGMDSGKIIYLGNPGVIDYERLKKQAPELVLTWDPSIIPMLDELGIACVITSTPVAMCLNARMSFVKFLAPFFKREKEAEDFFRRVNDSLADIRARTAGVLEKPKVMWGDMYEKRVLVEPGNAWIGELVALAQSGYLFEDVYGTSCIEISMERFLYSGQDADIYFTYRTPATGASSKATLAKLNPLMAGIKPLGPEGKVYAPLPHYSQSGDKLDEIFTELSAIMHPELYPGYTLKYFQEIPDIDPPISSSGEEQ
ncbi:MAG: ABC transporter substrate-binding protein [Desulfobulbaceae bacterium]|nr:ABC transporter substrate-binding protein [Desulfobulbaceae bacterium]